MDTARMRKAGKKSFSSLGATVRNFSGPVGFMSGGQKQSIAVARAAAWASRVIFLDEPTAALGVVQTKGVLDLIRRVRDDGIGVVFMSQEDATGSRMQRVLRLQALQIVLILLLIVVAFSSLAPDSFLSANNFRGIVINTAVLAVLAVLGVGMTFDLSVGSVLMFSGVVASKAMAAMGGQGWGVALGGLVVACLCGLAWGLVNGVLVAKAKVPPLIVTLGTLGMALGAAQIITGGIDLRDASDVLVDTVGFGNLVGRVPNLAVIAGVVVMLGMVLLHRTRPNHVQPYELRIPAGDQGT